MKPTHQPCPKSRHPRNPSSTTSLIPDLLERIVFFLFMHSSTLAYFSFSFLHTQAVMTKRPAPSDLHLLGEAGAPRMVGPSSLPRLGLRGGVYDVRPVTPQTQQRLFGVFAGAPDPIAQLSDEYNLGNKRRRLPDFEHFEGRRRYESVRARAFIMSELLEFILLHEEAFKRYVSTHSFSESLSLLPSPRARPPKSLNTQSLYSLLTEHPQPQPSILPLRRLLPPTHHKPRRLHRKSPNLATRPDPRHRTRRRPHPRRRPQSALHPWLRGPTPRITTPHLRTPQLSSCGIS